jgi:hypothetical protein
MEINAKKITGNFPVDECNRSYISAQRNHRTNAKGHARIMTTQSTSHTIAIRGNALDGACALVPAGMGSRQLSSLDLRAFSGSVGLVHPRTISTENPGGGSADVEVLQA